MENDVKFSRRDFIRTLEIAALGTSVASSLGSSTSVHAEAKKIINKDSGGP